MSPPPNTHRQDRKDEGMGGAGVSFKNKHTPQGYKHLPPSFSYYPCPIHLLLFSGWQQLEEIAAAFSLDHQHQHHSYSANTRGPTLSVSFLLSFFPLLQAGWSLFALKCLKKVAYQAPVVFWKLDWRGGATRGWWWQRQ